MICRMEVRAGIESILFTLRVRAIRKLRSAVDWYRQTRMCLPTQFHLAKSLRVVSEARRAMRLHEHGVFARFRYNDLKEVARDLRRTRALCKFNGGQERRRAVPRLCCRALHVTV